MDSTATGEPAAREIEGAGASRSRIALYSRHLMYVAILALIPMLMAGSLNRAKTLLVDPDIWWHLADARFLCTTHHFIHTDPYSFTAIGQAWIPWEWLSELPFWFSYEAFGLRGIYLVTWLLLAGNLIFLYWRGHLRSRSADAALLAAAVAFVLMLVNSGPRTIEFAYLAMSAELAVLEAADRGDRRWLWFLPPLFALWINLHGFWFAGIVLLAIYAAGGLFSMDVGGFQQKAFTAQERNQMIAVFLVSLAAMFANPYGWRLIWSPIDMMLNQKLSVATIAEWQPLDLSSAEGKGALIAVALMVVANCVRGRTWKLYELTFVFLAWYAAISHHRFTYFAAVLTTPMLAGDFARSFRIETTDKTMPAMNALMAGGALVLMLILFPSEASLKKRLAMMFPLQTISSIDPSWRTYNWDYVGGMMAFDSKPSFMDSRFDSFEHLGVMQEYRSILQGQDAFQIMEKYRVDHALLKDNLPVAGLLERAPGWHEVRREKAWDGSYVLFVRKPAAAGP